MSEIIRSEQIGELATALAKAKLNYGVVVRTKENTFTHSKYAELQDFMDAIQKPLAAEGLSFIHFPIEQLNEKRAGARTLLVHSTGQYIGNELLLPAAGKATGNVEKIDAQTIGAAITYAKRYNVQGLGDVVGESEDDGESISDKSSQGADVVKPKTVKAPPVSQKVSSQGGERPADFVRTIPGTRTVTNTPALPSEPVTITLPTSQTNDSVPVESSVVPKAVIPTDTAPVQLPLTPAESTSSQTEQPDKKADISGKPDKTQFDQYTARAVLLKIPLEKAGLKSSKGVQTGAKLKNYLLKFTGTKELSDLTIAQWEDFFTQHEQAIAADQAELIVAKIEGGKS